MNVEARPLDSAMLTRRCVVAKLSDLTLEKFKEATTQGAGGLLLLMPQDMTSLTPNERDVNELGTNITP